VLAKRRDERPLILETAVVRPNDFGDSPVGKSILLVINLVITTAVWFMLVANAPSLLHWTDDFLLATELHYKSITFLPVPLAKLRLIMEITERNLIGWLPTTFTGVFFVLSMLNLREGRLKNFIRMVTSTVAVLIIAVAIGSIFAVHNAAYSTLGDVAERWYGLEGTQRFKSIAPANVLESTTSAIIANIGIGVFLILSNVVITTTQQRSRKRCNFTCYRSLWADSIFSS